MKMLQSGAKPNEFSLICILKSCTAINRLHEGRLVHNCVLKEGFNNDKFINCSLLNLYSKCGSIEDAYKVFEGLKHRNVVAWSSMILGYTEHGLATEGIDLFNQMHFQGVVPNEITFVCVLKACWHLSAVEVGRDVYSYLLKLGLHLDVLVGSSLIDVYAACGKVDDARKVFDSLLEKNVVCWSAIISCHEEHGNYEEALLLYHNMQSEGAHADGFLFVIILNVCTNLRALNQGRIIHSEATKAGLASDLFVGSNLIDMYAKCGQVNDSFAVFDNLSVRDVVAWSALIEGLTMNEHEHEALRVFCDMINNRIMPNEVTFLSVLKASASMRDIRVGNAIFMYAIELGFHSVCAIGNTLVDLYAKGGSLEDAQVFFNKLSVQDLVSWNALIGGYVEKGHSFEAFLLVEKLQNKGFVGVDESTIWSMLKVCSCMAASHRGRLIHSAIVKYGLEKEMIIHNSLINMYTKCGFMLDALSIFDKSPVRTAVTWNALISGFAEHGHIMAAEWCFVNMQSDEISADEVTFVSLLSGCNHAGLIGEGFHLFHLMGTECYLTPTIQHFICLIDILGRAGCFYEAEDLIAKMPFEPDCVVWMSLLSSYEKHGWSQQAGQLFDVFLESSRTSAAAYVLMSNISVAN
ncbi:hypothetical protein KP509_26G072000 [Ceratopteris richardii]|nr:hypothetical protein KP509_26G072000 [Ceratopteris richardii]